MTGATNRDEARLPDSLHVHPAAPRASSRRHRAGEHRAPLNPRHPRARSVVRTGGWIAVGVLAVPVVLVLFAVVAWRIDSGDEREVLRGVEVAGRPVGGLDVDELDVVLDELAAEYPASAVRVETPEGDLVATGAEVGLTLDVVATRAAVAELGRDGTRAERFGEWLRSFQETRPSPVQVAVDRSALAPVVVDRDPTGRVLPVEPGIAMADGDLVVVPGVDGRGLDPATVAERIVAEGANGELPVVVQAEAEPVLPRMSAADAERFAAAARARTDTPLVVQAAGTTAEVASATQRSWLQALPDDGELRLEVDRTHVQVDVEALLAGAGQRPQNASFVVEGDGVAIVPGATGTRCCAPEAAEIVAQAVLDRPDGAVALPVVDAPPDRSVSDADALGIRVPIGSFTTYYAAGQSRVQNIHRIADLTRGVVIEPGGSFSVNAHVGRRTVEKGFAPGGVIQDGIFEESVGGGISQYATTLFNAAFFAGLDFGAYQSHSIYISRYPYGREATLSYPQPDLVIENDTPYGVLIWPTYTDTSLTVTLYSTPYATGEQTDQSEAPAGNCTRVTTERTRTYVDGRTDVDEVYATYRPEEGVDC